MKFTVETKLLLLFVFLVGFSHVAGEPVYNALHGEDTVVDKIKENPYYHINN